MDVVYICRPGDDNPELRYSLRSLAANAPWIDKVWIVGHTPSWVTGVHSLHTIQAGSKYQNSTRNVATACEHGLVSDPFILLNDDFHIVRPITAVPTLHRGPMDTVIDHYRRKGSTKYVRGMQQTRDLLQTLGHTKPLSYELHVPLVVHKPAMRDAITLGLQAELEVIHKRTLYGNLARLGGTETTDVKVYDMDQELPTGPFLSSMDKTFRYGVGNVVRWLFPNPCQYEAESMAGKAAA